MQYDQFVELHQRFPCGRYEINSFQLRNLLLHEECLGVAVRVLHVGTLQLDRTELIERLRPENHPRLDNIKITCLDGEVIIDEPSHVS